MIQFFEWLCDCGNEGCSECDPKKRNDESNGKEDS